MNNYPNQPPYQPNNQPYPQQPYQPNSAQQPYPPQRPGQFGQPPYQPYPQQQPYQPMQQPYPNNPMANQPPGPPPRKRRRWWIWVLVAIGFIVVVSSCNAIISGGKGVGNTNAAAPTNAPTQASSQATNAPTPQAVQYPPKTKTDLHGLAALGDASAIHEFHSESVGLTGVCPQPKRLVTVDPSIPGKQLAEDLLAYFYANQLDSPCGSLVGAYHSQSESNDAFTAGRINFDVTDSSGQVNTDPNATGLSYKLTLDVGDVLAGQEYIVSY